MIALLAGVAYAFVAIPSQTQLQEDIPEDTRGRVFGVLNMLVSVSSFLPIIIAGAVSDLIGTQTVLLIVAIAISASGVISIIRRGPLNPTEARATAHWSVAPRPGWTRWRSRRHRSWTQASGDMPASGTARRSPQLPRPPQRRELPSRRAARCRPMRRPTWGTHLRQVVPPRPNDHGSGGPPGHRPDRDARGPGRARVGRGDRRRRGTGRCGGIGGGRGRPGRPWHPAPRARSRTTVAIPGLTDAHLHLAEAALARRRVDLDDARSIDAVIELVRAAAATVTGPDAWIEGAGWDADLLGSWPTAADLDRAAPGRLVALWAHDHHALLASTRAMAEAGIDDDRGDPDGGVIRRDDAGHVTGVLHETAARLVAGRIPAPDADLVVAALRPMISELVALGVVAAHDPGGLSVRRDLGGPLRGIPPTGRERRPCDARASRASGPEQLDAAAAAGLRSGQPIGPDPLDRLRLGWLKTFADGSLGSRTAALLEPLRPDPRRTRAAQRGLRRLARPARVSSGRRRRGRPRCGIATQIHGIGDAAVRAALDALAPTVGRTPLMPRVEHVQLVSTADIPRFAALGIAASMQPVHVRSDAEKARRLWGARAEERGYALGALAATGAVIPTGTDAPVEPVDPWPGLACAVTRSAPSWPAGTPPFGSGNALDLWRAIRAACVDPAISAGETDRGRLVPGHRADIVVVSAAALAEPVETGGALWNARPRMVLMDGLVVAEA